MSPPSYFRFCSRYWRDEKVTGWSDDERLLSLYLLTCPHGRSEGLFFLPKDYICADLKWPRERLEKAFAKLLADRFIDYDETAGVILIRNALKYQAPDNPNQVTSAINHIEELPETPLLKELYELSEQFSERLAQGLKERYGQYLYSTLYALDSNSNSSSSNPDSLKEKSSQPSVASITKATGKKSKVFEEDSEPYRLADLLRQEILTNLPDAKVSKNLSGWCAEIDRMIRRDNRKPEDIEAVIRWCQSDDFWSPNILSAKKLREKYDQLNGQMKKGQKHGKLDKKREGASDGRRVGYGKP